jgi:LPXTG-motif cell wall-anchored protein
VSGIGFNSAITVGSTETPATPTTIVTVTNLPATGNESDQMPFALGIIALVLALVGFKRRRLA